MAVVYAVLIAINLILTSWGGRIAIIMSILNFLIFFLYYQKLPKGIPEGNSPEAGMLSLRCESRERQHGDKA